MNMNAEELKKEILEYLDETKAEDVAEYEVGTRTSLADWFILATGTSDRHVGAMAQELRRRYKPILRRRVEGGPESGWILLDFGDVVIHLFTEHERERIDLDEVWKEVNHSRNRTATEEKSE